MQAPNSRSAFGNCTVHSSTVHFSGPDGLAKAIDNHISRFVTGVAPKPTWKVVVTNFDVYSQAAEITVKTNSIHVIIWCRSKSIDVELSDYEQPSYDWGGLMEIYNPMFSTPKLLMCLVKPGASTDLCMHKDREEQWIVLNGIGKMSIGKSYSFPKTTDDISKLMSTIVQRGSHIRIKPGTPHTIENLAGTPLAVCVIQIGSVCDPSDVVFFDRSLVKTS